MLSKDSKQAARVARRCKTTPETLRAFANALELASQNAGKRDVVMVDFEDDLILEFDPNQRSTAEALRERIQLAGQTTHLEKKA